MERHFEDCLTTRDCKRHILHSFIVPQHCERLDVDFRFTPEAVQDLRNLLTLTIFDPDGFRGAGHRGGNIHRVHIASEAATPGYVAGPLPAGEWIVQIDTHLIMPGEPLHYSLDVLGRIGSESSSTAPGYISGSVPAATARVARDGAGWYRGDLHAHTCHSDAAAFTVQDLIRAARSHDLDFVFLTDHNTISGLAEMDGASSADLLAAGGIELTTFWGHALCLGTRQWVDWRLRPRGGEMAKLAEKTNATDQLFVIAHPQADGDPGCTGCSWRYGDMMPGSATAVEIWNGPWAGDSNNEQALLLFYDWLNQGLRLVATAGTDAHGPAPEGGDLRLGFNRIYAESLSERALITALRAGHLYLSSGPELLFEALTEEGDRRMVGDTISAEAVFSVRWDACPQDAHLRVIAEGRPLHAWPARGCGDRQWTMAPRVATSVVVELRSADGEMLAVTNPIFLEQPVSEQGA